jgi:hypothetical protein
MALQCESSARFGDDGMPNWNWICTPTSIRLDNYTDPVVPVEKPIKGHDFIGHSAGNSRYLFQRSILAGSKFGIKTVKRSFPLLARPYFTS